jgi:hypothetical protein
MKEIKAYEAEDGKKFDTSTECLNYEKYVHQLEKIMAQLPKRPDDCVLIKITVIIHVLYVAKKAIVMESVRSRLCS